MKILNIQIKINLPRYAIRKAKVIFRSKPIKVIEVGVYKGENSLEMINNLNIKKIYLVDSYKPYKQKDYGFEKDKNNSVGKFSKELEQAKNQAHKVLDFDCCEFIEKESSQAVKDIKDKVDLIYIDGNHDYEFVKNDIENYFPLLKDNGLIAGHDAHLIPVMKAVAEFSYKNNLSLSVRDSDWIIYKGGLT